MFTKTKLLSLIQKILLSVQEKKIILSRKNQQNVSIFNVFC